MEDKKIEDALAERLRENNHRESHHGKYHPSTISGCPLKALLDRMTDKETILNRWLFQGSAVHYYLQEKPGLLRDALHDAGYHSLETDFEVPTIYPVEEGIFITGTCDILTHGHGKRSVIDIKYSSIPPSSGHGRIWKYASQVNTYANMFDCDEWGLMMINSKSDNIPEDITMISQEADEENFELIQDKARNIHSALSRAGWQDGERWDPTELDAKMDETWEMVFDFISTQNCPSYDQECKYCDHKEYCPVKQGETGGLVGMGK